MAHPLRPRILDYLETQGELRVVTDIVAASGAYQAIVSQQLRILRVQGVVGGERVGHTVLYHIADRATVEPMLKYTSW
jgi:DNA-binding transcriptional ArsR family regulator